ncbi:MAG: N-formylglutamate deformylase [Pseudomonadota bacterium]
MERRRREAAVFDQHVGESPLVVSFPHSGTQVPAAFAGRFVGAAERLPDTDWCMPELYDFVADYGASTIVARMTRYVVDLNRPPSSERLYAAHASTGVCPTTTFSGEAIYREGDEPDDAERKLRIERYWQPYHDALEALMTATADRFGYALLYDAHSIAPIVPRLFTGTLPSLNLGTAHGESCDPALSARIESVIEDSPYTHAINGRFVGGYITRHYGQPERHWQAVQMELSQHTHLNVETATLDPALTQKLRKTLRAVMHAFTVEPPRD